MSKGIVKRRRIKRALEAARGNLKKIANGKALKVGLPEAPEPTDAEKLPASLRKMLALKEVAAKRDGKTSANEAAAGQEQQQQGRKRGRKAGMQLSGDEDGPSTSGREETAQAAQRRLKKEGVRGANPFTEQFAPKKLKDTKKDFLKRNQEKKRKKGKLVVEKELTDKVKFGEVVHAPLEVHLKRRNWADKEKSSNERCKEIFLNQMQQAQQRMADATVDDGTAPGSAAGSGGPGKGKKRKAPVDADTETIRQQVIDSYRAAKKAGGFHNAAVGNATLNSLSRLVGNGGGGKAAHTLG